MISIWEKETFFAPQDVVIAGSGFTGLWTALFMKRKYPHLAVSILERGPIPTGASTRNAGFACFGSLSELVYDARVMGTDRMLELVEMRYRGLERIQKFFPAAALDFTLCGGYELYADSHPITAAELQDQIDYLNTLLKPVTGAGKTYKLVDELVRTYGFGFTRHLVFNKFEGCLHAGKLVKALLQQVQAMGVQVFTNTEILGFEEAENEVTVHTALQPFKTRQLVVCTNAFARSLLPDLELTPARGQVLLTTPIEGLPWQGTFHADEGYYYFRNLGDRVLLGGARNKAFQEETTTEMTPTDHIQGHLEHYLDTVILPRFRGQYTIEHRWAGIMGMGPEKMPIIERLRPRISCAVRMSGMGVALAPIAARKLVKLLKEDLV